MSASLADFTMSGSAICAMYKLLFLSLSTHNIFGNAFARQVLDVLVLRVDDLGQLAAINQLLVYPHLDEVFEYV